MRSALRFYAKLWLIQHLFYAIPETQVLAESPTPSTVQDEIVKAMGFGAITLTLDRPDNVCAPKPVEL